MSSGQKITQTEVMRLAHLICDELLAGDGASALRLAESIVTQSTPFPMLDLMGRTIAQNTAKLVPGPFLTLLDEVGKLQSPGAWPIIGSAIYAAFAHTLLPSAMEHARRHISRAADQHAADVIGARVPGQLLVNYFEQGLSPLYDWVSDKSPWVRRAIGIATQCYVINRPQEPGQIARLLQLLSLLYQEKNVNAIKGIGRGLKLIGKHQPEMLAYWLFEQRELNRQPHALMLRHATTFLPADVKSQILDDKA